MRAWLHLNESSVVFQTTSTVQGAGLCLQLLQGFAPAGVPVTQDLASLPRRHSPW